MNNQEQEINEGMALSGPELGDVTDPDRIVGGKPASYWVQYVKDKTKAQKEQRFQLEKGWFQNLCMYKGLHYYSWNDEARALREPRTPAYRVKIVCNYTLASSEIAMAKLLKNPPRSSVRATNASNEAMAKAKLAEQDLQYRYRQLKMANKRRDAIKWAVVCGTGFLKHIWNPHIGQMWTEPVEPMFSSGQTEEEKFYFMGDQEVVVCSPFEVECDEPNTSDIEACGWVRHKQIASLEKVRGEHPEFEDLLKAETDYDKDNVVDTRFLGMVDTVSMRPQKLDDKIVKMELWQRAWSLSKKERAKFPRGRRILIAGDQLLEFGTGPNDEIDIPFVKYDFIVPPGQFWGMGIPDLMTGLNKAYNRMYSKLLENIALHCAPKWVASKGAGLGQHAIDSEPAEVIEHNDGTPPPTQTNPPNLVGTGFFEGMRTNLEAQKDVTGLQDVSRGTAPASASGVALTQLEEADATRLGIVVRAMELAEGESGTMILKLDKQFVIEPRMIDIQGKGGWVDPQEFTGMQLDSTMVEVEAGSGLPTSKATTRAMVMEAWSQGILPKDKPEVAIKLLDMGVPDGLVRENFADAELADEENRHMKNGVPQQVMPWYDDDVHIARHDLERKQGDFLSLDPQIQQLFEQHDQDHKANKKRKQQEAMAEQAAMQPPMPQGQPGAPGQQPPAQAPAPPA